MAWIAIHVASDPSVWDALFKEACKADSVPQTPQEARAFPCAEALFRETLPHGIDERAAPTEHSVDHVSARAGFAELSATVATVSIDAGRDASACLPGSHLGALDLELDSTVFVVP